MPSIYLDRPLMSVISDEQDRLKREAEKDLPDDEEVYVSEREAILELFSDEAERRVRRERS